MCSLGKYSESSWVWIAELTFLWSFDTVSAYRCKYYERGRGEDLCQAEISDNSDPSPSSTYEKLPLHQASCLSNMFSQGLCKKRQWSTIFPQFKYANPKTLFRKPCIIPGENGIWYVATVEKRRKVVLTLMGWLTILQAAGSTSLSLVIWYLTCWMISPSHVEPLYK